MLYFVYVLYFQTELIPGNTHLIATGILRNLVLSGLYFPQLRSTRLCKEMYLALVKFSVNNLANVTTLLEMETELT